MNKLCGGEPYGRELSAQAPSDVHRRVAGITEHAEAILHRLEAASDRLHEMELRLLGNPVKDVNCAKGLAEGASPQPPELVHLHNMLSRIERVSEDIDEVSGRLDGI